MVMTVLLHDANTLLVHDHDVHLNHMCCSELVYADDTLLVGLDTHQLQKCMECIAQVGGHFGLALNWTKVEQVNVNCDVEPVRNPQGVRSTLKSQ